MKTKIFVTIGSMFPFDRLIKEVDNIGENKKYSIIAQIGNSNYIAKNIITKSFFDQKEFEKQIELADLVICHGAIVTITQALEKNKRVIIVPRQKKFGEAIDDHQLEIAPLLEKKYNIKSITNIKDLEKEILNKKKNKIVKPKVSQKLIKEIDKIIE